MKIATMMIVAAIASCTLSPSANAAYFDDTGNELLAMCEATETIYGRVGCFGEIVGHYDMMRALGYSCGDDRVKNKQQIRDVVVKYLRNHPETRDQPAASLSFSAIMSAFHCKPPTP